MRAEAKFRVFEFLLGRPYSCGDEEEDEDEHDECDDGDADLGKPKNPCHSSRLLMTKKGSAVRNGTMG